MPISTQQFPHHSVEKQEILSHQFFFREINFFNNKPEIIRPNREKRYQVASSFSHF